MSAWTRAEVGVLVRAVSNAPSVHDTMPWILETREHRADLYENVERSLPHHDPTGRDRLISCGAALANLRLAVRSLGWRFDVTLYPERRGDLVARLTTTARQPATETELASYWSMFRRRSYRKPFLPDPVTEAEIVGVVSAAAGDGVRLRRVERDECRALATLLCYAADVLRADKGYQRELDAWTRRYARYIGGSDGHRGARPRDTLPWAGLVSTDTRLPDVPTLARRLAEETLFVVVSDTDTPVDHVRAGEAMQRAWLAAVSDGLAGAVLTQALHLSEVRSGMVDRLGLAGYPQVLLRIGRPEAVIKARQRDVRERLHAPTH
ncbi:Acg family FMN-binding oxidoreductase [Haloechinothrix salitolerans]|uniref:Acg family FMN-binding oxidoreductase n=1 Tax=Haloechinothrix salitolerans TaxID=926830 RepID=A0ABW2C2E7_9PSEU